MYSPDGRWWWNGAEWVPAPQWRTRYEHTPWTRKLQIAVLGLQALGLLFAAATFPFKPDTLHALCFDWVYPTPGSTAALPR